MNRWLVSWKTWFEGEVDPPWPWIPVDRVQEYKHRDNPDVKISPEQIETVYLSFNPDIIARFEYDHVDAIVLAGMIDADDERSAISSVISMFPDAEIETCSIITDDILPAMLDMFKKNER